MIFNIFHRPYNYSILNTAYKSTLCWSVIANLNSTEWVLNADFFNYLSWWNVRLLLTHSIYDPMGHLENEFSKHSKQTFYTQDNFAQAMQIFWVAKLLYEPDCPSLTNPFSHSLTYRVTEITIFIYSAWNSTIQLGTETFTFLFHPLILRFLNFVFHYQKIVIALYCRPSVIFVYIYLLLTLFVLI